MSKLNKVRANRINIADLPNGMYFFTLAAEGKRRVTKSVFVIR